MKRSVSKPKSKPEPEAQLSLEPVREAAQGVRSGLPPVLPVSQLVRAARHALEEQFGDVRVEGEISGLKRSGNGHLYFCLKDPEAQLDCVLFARDAVRLKFRIEDGLQVRCRGRLTIYEGRGRFQLTVSSMEPAGAGALALAFERLKEKLRAEGLFDPARKRPLPFLPRRIGVVTSAQGAVIQDIIRVAHRRFPVPILLAPAPVQGPGAAAALVLALETLSQVPGVDLIILARGGGSLEDLWAFNDEALARAIAVCPVPVVSAVGHETDFTICDFVADLRAPTPSAAAELAVPVANELATELQVLGRRLGRAVQAQVHGERLGLERLKTRLGDPRRLIDQRRQALDEITARAGAALRTILGRHRAEWHATCTHFFRTHPQHRIATQRGTVAVLEKRLCAAAATRLARGRSDLSLLDGRLKALSPLNVLERGYSLARGPDGRLLTSAEGLGPGDAVTILFRDGEADTRVEQVRRNTIS
jgi:exodeoxyribonuclease VII large subunit